jgi:hypothetical protein
MLLVQVVEFMTSSSRGLGGRGGGAGGGSKVKPDQQFDCTADFVLHLPQQLRSCNSSRMPGRTLLLENGR